MQRSEEVPLAVAVILPFPADNTASPHYTGWEIRHRHMGKKKKMKNVNQCCRTLISRGLDHSHWFCCLCALPVGWNTAGEDAYTVAGYCVDRGAPSEWMICIQQTFPPADGGLFSVLFRNGFSQKKCWDCNLLCNGPKCLLSIFLLHLIEKLLTCRLAD